MSSQDRRTLFKRKNRGITACERFFFFKKGVAVVENQFSAKKQRVYCDQLRPIDEEAPFVLLFELLATGLRQIRG